MTKPVTHTPKPVTLNNPPVTLNSFQGLINSTEQGLLPLLPRTTQTVTLNSFQGLILLRVHFSDAARIGTFSIAHFLDAARIGTFSMTQLRFVKKSSQINSA